MILDLALGAILLLSCILGFRRGFAVTFFHTLSWVISVILAFLWTPKVNTFLRQETDLYENLLKRLTDKFRMESVTAADSAFSQFPQLIRDAITTAANTVTDSFAGSLADALLSLLSFLLVILAVKLILLLLSSMFSHKDRGGFFGWLDHMAGLAFGTIKGMILICVLVAALVPANNLLGGAWINEQLADSVVTQYLYENNPLFVIANSATSAGL